MEVVAPLALVCPTKAGTYVVFGCPVSTGGPSGKGSVKLSLSEEQAISVTINAAKMV